MPPRLPPADNPLARRPGPGPIPQDHIPYGLFMCDETGRVLPGYSDSCHVGRLQIALSDDGKGIATEAVAARALKLGAITPAQLEGMSREEILQLIFLDGLSTAETLSDISGRGVGMAAVKSNVEAAGGRLSIVSEAGRGTEFRLDLPTVRAA